MSANFPATGVANVAKSKYDVMIQGARLISSSTVEIFGMAVFKTVWSSADMKMISSKPDSAPIESFEIFPSAAASEIVRLRCLAYLSDTRHGALSFRCNRFICGRVFANSSINHVGKLL